VLEVVFILLEPLSLLRRIFIGSHSLPPLWVAVSILQPVRAWALRMNNEPRVTSPNPLPNPSIRSTDSRKTLGILGVPHGHPIATIWSTKTCRINRNQRISTKNTTFLKYKKTPKSSTFSHGFVRGITRKRTMKGSSIHPQLNPKEKGLKSTIRKSQGKGSENHQKGKREKQHKVLRNHAESSIRTMKVHTRSSLPHDHPILSKDLTMKLSG
jgi:hypothetical protein